MMSDQEWNPKYADNTIDPADPSFYGNTPKLLQRLPHVDYNVHGEYVKAFPTQVPASDPVPNDTAPASDPVPNDTAPDPVPASHTQLPASNPFPPVPVPATIPALDPSPPKPHSNAAYLVIRKELQQPLLSEENACSALFEEFTARCIVENAIKDNKDQDQFYDAVDNQASADF